MSDSQKWAVYKLDELGAPTYRFPGLFDERGQAEKYAEERQDEVNSHRGDNRVAVRALPYDPHWSADRQR